MNEDRFNMDIRKFLKTVGVTSQRAIELAVRNALANAVLRSLAIDMPEIDVSNIPQAAITRRRFATGVPPTDPKR